MHHMEGLWATAHLRGLLDSLSDSTSVYQSKGKKETVPYSGKAESARMWVSSCLRTRGPDKKTPNSDATCNRPRSDSHQNRAESTTLKATLTKRQEKYNIALRDDRQHARVGVDLLAKTPFFVNTWDVARDAARYFDPYGGTQMVVGLLMQCAGLFP